MNISRLNCYQVDFLLLLGMNSHEIDRNVSFKKGVKANTVKQQDVCLLL